MRKLQTTACLIICNVDCDVPNQMPVRLNPPTSFRVSAPPAFAVGRHTTFYADFRLEKNTKHVRSSHCAGHLHPDHSTTTWTPQASLLTSSTSPASSDIGSYYSPSSNLGTSNCNSPCGPVKATTPSPSSKSPDCYAARHYRPSTKATASYGSSTY